ncbi:NADH:flavin oxidoreductase/NADH oxidase [Aciduricibacillus chroicocephali]|uniref:NADH:flavin oxidoreductase/NADH oxidase n=1 Tax=Aciduricibacillus chroicocephali TaxID=3054939 RepID=A0ABY9KXZ7_9BACI|nr:NADH:flavin oxidoreductase/NADH oxidase [Bacillaceae bacterium 44XB]
MAKLTSSFELKNMKLKNRIVMSPMCQYSVEAEDGVPTDWHYVHYVSRAVGGAGLILVEAAAVDPEGRISSRDLGIWSDEQIPAYKKLVDEVHKHGAKIGIQLAHAGRKAEDAIQPVSASDTPLNVREGEEAPKTPRALSTGEASGLVDKFKEAARRAVEAGFDTVEIHGAHGYLIHQFMSPSVNNRSDEYGKDLAKFGVDVTKAVKEVVPKDYPVIMRMSAIEYEDGGYGLDHAIEIAKQFKTAGVDVFDVSTGGEGPPGKLKPGNYPGYQVPFAREFKKTLEVPVIAVGMLEDFSLAEAVIANGDADLAAIGRGMLNDPYWAIHAEKALDGKVDAPVPYKRGIR